jgi:hypothetical protein
MLSQLFTKVGSKHPVSKTVAAVAPFVESRRPAHWVEKEILAYALSAASAYIALRIRKQPAHHLSEEGKSRQLA